MMSDIRTVMWKERKGLFRQQGSLVRVLLTLLIPMAVFAIWTPWQEGRGWLESPFSLIVSVFIPMLLVGMMIPESFAGERERHTLETLLSSRLPDRAILFGKIAMSVGLAWGITLFALLLALVTLNIVHWEGQIMFYTPTIALVNIALSFILASIMACLGVLISLRAATVQGAQQTLMFATLMPLTLLGVIVTVVLGSNSQWIERFKEIVGSIDSTHLILIVGAVLVVACLGLLWAAMNRFQRARLILN
ncbi:MAG: ABC transporter permease [Chloroflexota bacterium]|nr:ABC transporter permease [Chloroflexota bacterium]